MSKAAHWVIPHVVCILAALLAGPYLSHLPTVQSIQVPVVPLTGSALLRLSAECIAYVLIFSLVLNLTYLISNKVRGGTFFRNVLPPLALLGLIVVADKSIRHLGRPLIDLLGMTEYLWIYSAGMVLAGLWLTTMWIRTFGSLGDIFAAPGPIRTKPQRAADESEEPEIRERREPPTTPKEVTPPTVAARPAPSTLGRYVVVRELGRGAMGIVYLGRDPKIQRQVAIKTMRLDQIGDVEKVKEVKARFFREAESAGRLSHPSIVTIYDAGEQNALCYIAMELLVGQTLKHWSRPPNLMAPTEVVNTLATVAETLDYAHQQGVVHRDVKPANIMVTKDGQVKVMDFGIAKMISNSATQTDIVLGTPTYMSPEQISGDRVDGRTDVFSLGIVLFELLTGRPPFTADNLSALLFTIAHKPHPALNSFCKDLPPQFQEVLDRALQKDVSQRYRRAGEFARDLRSCVQSLAA